MARLAIHDAKWDGDTFTAKLGARYVRRRGAGGFLVHTLDRESG